MKPYLVRMRAVRKATALRTFVSGTTGTTRYRPRGVVVSALRTPAGFRPSIQHFHTSSIRREVQAASQTPPTKRSFKPVRRILLGFCVVSGVAVALTGLVAAITYSTHFETTPVTGRRRFMWYNVSKDEEIGYWEQNFLLDQYKKLQLASDDMTTKAVQGILDRLKTSKYAEGFNWRLHFIDDFEWPNNFAVPGGQIYINTGMILECKNPDQVAGTLAHEMGHIIARHGAEAKSANIIGKWLSTRLGLEGELGRNLVLSRKQESEADQIGLIIMADTGFDPEERVNAVRDRLTKDVEQLKGRDPYPEFLSTHPSAENRLLQHEQWLPTAAALYEKRGRRTITEEDEKTWLQCRSALLVMSLESSRVVTNTNINERIDECQKKHLQLSNELWKLRDELFGVAVEGGHVKDREVTLEDADDDEQAQTTPTPVDTSSSVDDEDAKEEEKTSIVVMTVEEIQPVLDGDLQPVVQKEIKIDTEATPGLVASPSPPPTSSQQQQQPEEEELKPVAAEESVVAAAMTSGMKMPVENMADRKSKK